MELIISILVMLGWVYIVFQVASDKYKPSKLAILVILIAILIDRIIDVLNLIN